MAEINTGPGPVSDQEPPLPTIDAGERPVFVDTAETVDTEAYKQWTVSEDLPNGEWAAKRKDFQEFTGQLPYYLKEHPNTNGSTTVEANVYELYRNFFARAHLMFQMDLPNLQDQDLQDLNNITVQDFLLKLRTYLKPIGNPNSPEGQAILESFDRAFNKDPRLQNIQPEVIHNQLELLKALEVYLYEEGMLQEKPREPAVQQLGEIEQPASGPEPLTAPDPEDAKPPDLEPPSPDPEPGDDNEPRPPPEPDPVQVELPKRLVVGAAGVPRHAVVETVQAAKYLGEVRKQRTPPRGLLGRIGSAVTAPVRVPARFAFQNIYQRHIFKRMVQRQKSAAAKDMYLALKSGDSDSPVSLNTELLAKAREQAERQGGNIFVKGLNFIRDIPPNVFFIGKTTNERRMVNWLKEQAELVADPARSTGADAVVRNAIHGRSLEEQIAIGERMATDINDGDEHMSIEQANRGVISQNLGEYRYDVMEEIPDPQERIRIQQLFNTKVRQEINTYFSRCNTAGWNRGDVEVAKTELHNKLTEYFTSDGFNDLLENSGIDKDKLKKLRNSFQTETVHNIVNIVRYLEEEVDGTEDVNQQGQKLRRYDIYQNPADGQAGSLWEHVDFALYAGRAEPGAAQNEAEVQSIEGRILQKMLQRQMSVFRAGALPESYVGQILHTAKGNFLEVATVYSYTLGTIAASKSIETTSRLFGPLAFGAFSGLRRAYGHLPEEINTYLRDRSVGRESESGDQLRKWFETEGLAQPRYTAETKITRLRTLMESVQTDTPSENDKKALLKEIAELDARIRMSQQPTKGIQYRFIKFQEGEEARQMQQLQALRLQGMVRLKELDMASFSQEEITYKDNAFFAPKQTINTPASGQPLSFNTYSAVMEAQLRIGSAHEANNRKLAMKWIRQQFKTTAEDRRAIQQILDDSSGEYHVNLSENEALSKQQEIVNKLKWRSFRNTAITATVGGYALGAVWDVIDEPVTNFIQQSMETRGANIVQGIFTYDWNNVGGDVGETVGNVAGQVPGALSDAYYGSMDFAVLKPITALNTVVENFLAQEDKSLEALAHWTNRMVLNGWENLKLSPQALKQIQWSSLLNPERIALADENGLIETTFVNEQGEVQRIQIPSGTSIEESDYRNGGYYNLTFTGVDGSEQVLLRNFQVANNGQILLFSRSSDVQPFLEALDFGVNQETTKLELIGGSDSLFGEYGRTYDSVPFLNGTPEADGSELQLDNVVRDGAFVFTFENSVLANQINNATIESTIDPNTAIANGELYYSFTIPDEGTVLFQADANGELVLDPNSSDPIPIFRDGAIAGEIESGKLYELLINEQELNNALGFDISTSTGTTKVGTEIFNQQQILNLANNGETGIAQVVVIPNGSDAALPDTHRTLATIAGCGSAETSVTTTEVTPTISLKEDVIGLAWWGMIDDRWAPFVFPSWLKTPRAGTRNNYRKTSTVPATLDTEVATVTLLTQEQQDRLDAQQRLAQQYNNALHQQYNPGLPVVEQANIVPMAIPYIQRIVANTSTTIDQNDAESPEVWLRLNQNDSTMPVIGQISGQNGEDCIVVYNRSERRLYVVTQDPNDPTNYTTTYLESRHIPHLQFIQKHLANLEVRQHIALYLSTLTSEKQQSAMQSLLEMNAATISGSAFEHFSVSQNSSSPAQNATVIVANGSFMRIDVTEDGSNKSFEVPGETARVIETLPDEVKDKNIEVVTVPNQRGLTLAQDPTDSSMLILGSERILKADLIAVFNGTYQGFERWLTKRKVTVNGVDTFYPTYNIPVITQSGRVVILRGSPEEYSTWSDLALSEAEIAQRQQQQHRIFAAGVSSRVDSVGTESARLIHQVGSSSYRVSAASNSGGIRETDEDALLSVQVDIRTMYGPVPLRLNAVADGMGGMAGGQQASALYARVAQEELNAIARQAAQYAQTLSLTANGRTFDLDLTHIDEENQVKTLMEYIRQKVIERSRTETLPDGRPLFGSGRDGRDGGDTTLAAVLMVGAKTFSVHSGDARIYRKKNDGSVQQITDDHAPINQMVQASAITPDAARNSPHRNAVSRPLIHSNEPSEIAEITPLGQGEALIIVCDGVPDGVDESYADPDNPPVVSGLIHGATGQVNPAAHIVNGVLAHAEPPHIFAGTSDDNVSAVVIEPMNIPTSS